MTPNAVKEGCVLPENLELFLEMRRIVEAIDDFVLGPRILTCQHICYALTHHFEVQVENGYFGIEQSDAPYKHSWLVLEKFTVDKDGRFGKVIADMCPVGGASPILFGTHWILPWTYLYREDRKYTCAVLSDPKFANQVIQVARHIATLK